MTKMIVPFIHALEEQNAQQWITVLNVAMPEIDVRPVNTLSDAERISVEVAIVANPDPKDLAALPNLRWVQSLWAGVECLLQATPDNDVEIVRLTDLQLAQTMAEAVLAWTLYLHRDMPRYAAQQKQAYWQQHDVPITISRRVSVFGLGKLGQSAAHRLAANGFDVRGWSRSPKILEGVQCFFGAQGMNQILSETDILVILLPSTPSTRGLLNGAAFDCLPKGAQIINFARADIIDAEVLVERLASGHINHAVLDVFKQEPLASNDPLWTNPCVTILPHISAPTNRETAAVLVAQHLRAWFADGTMPTPVSRHNGY